MMREWSDLFEAIDNPLPISWQSQTPTYWSGHFMAGEEEYFVSADCGSEGFPDPDDPGRDAPWFDLGFGITRNGLSGDRVIGSQGWQFRIFATAIAGFREFIHAEKPPLIMLSASKDNPNRLPLYQRLARRLTPEIAQLGYRSCPAPENRYVATHKYFDTMAWRRDAVE